MFTVIEPASVLICACMPMTQCLLRRLTISNLSSKFSFSLSGSAQKSGLSSSNRSQPVRHIEIKSGPWTKLDESLLAPEANFKGDIGNKVTDGDDTYELASRVATPKRAHCPIEAQDLV